MFAGPKYQWLSIFVPHAADKCTCVQRTTLASILLNNLSAMDPRACFFIMQACLQILSCFDRRCTVDTPASVSALLIVLQSSKVESCMLKHLEHL